MLSCELLPSIPVKCSCNDVAGEGQCGVPGSNGRQGQAASRWQSSLVGLGIICHVLRQLLHCRSQAAQRAIRHRACRHACPQLRVVSNNGLVSAGRVLYTIGSVPRDQQRAANP